MTLAAARNAWACGQTGRARALLAAARQLTADPLLLSGIARLQGRIEVNLGSATDAHRIFVEAAHAVHEIDPSRALEMAVAAAIMRTYGADSGSSLGAGDIDVDDHRRRHAPHGVPQADARRDDPGRRRRLGRGRDRAGRGGRARRRRRRPRRAREPRQRRPPARRRRRPAALLRPGAVPGSRGGCGDGGRSTRCSGCASDTWSPATGPRFAAAPRRRSSSAPSLRAACAHGSAAGLAHASGRAPGPRRLRPPAGRRRGGGRGVPAGHPDRPGPRPDPMGEGRPCGGRRRRLRSRCTTSPGCVFPRLPTDGRRRAHRRSGPRGRTRPGPAVGRRARRVRRGHRSAVGAAPPSPTDVR